jgi:hypothetical protein
MRPHQKAMSLIFGMALILTTPLSAPFWRYVPYFDILQFPWRWLSVMELTLCFLVASAISGSVPPFPVSDGIPGRMALYAITAILSLSFLLIMKHDSMYTSSFLSMITNAEQVLHYANRPKEYTPIWACDVEEIMARGNYEKISSLSGNTALRILEWQPERRAFAVNASVPERLRIATFFYPVWKAEIKGKESDGAIEERTGAMLVKVPSGEHTLKLTFGDTWLRAIARYVSFSFCAILAIFALFINKSTESGTPRS